MYCEVVHCSSGYGALVSFQQSLNALALGNRTGVHEGSHGSLHARAPVHVFAGIRPRCGAGPGREHGRLANLRCQTPDPWPQGQKH